MDRLITKFHGLEGDTLQEKRKAFNRLLTQIEQELTTDESLNEFVSALTPKSKLEEILKIEILVRFQRNSVLLDTLKSGNVVLIKKVLNCWRFFETAFADIDADTLVKDVFHQVSFSTRMKVITKLATNLKDEALADSYFEAIKQKYGLKIATAILPACSLGLIKSTVAKFKVKLSERQVLKLFRKHRALFLTDYFDALHKDRKNVSNEYSMAIKHVARVDGELFWKMHEKYDVSVKFGRHMTSYIYADERGKKYKAQFYNSKKVYAIIKNDERKLREYLTNLYPKSIYDFYPEYSRYHRNTLIDFVGHIPKSKRYAIVSGCFEESYGKNLAEYDSDAIPESILEIMPMGERKIVIDQKVLKDECYMYMWPADEAIETIQDRIRYTTSTTQRQELLLQMYKTCSFNDDHKALLDVLKYVRRRCKNNETLLVAFMNQLSEWKYLERLSDEHWAQINELIKPLLINSKLYTDSKFMESYFKRRLNMGGLHDDFLKLVVKKMTERTSMYYHILNDKRTFDKKCMEHMATLLPKMLEGDEYQAAAVWLLMTMVQYNKRNWRSKIFISNYPNFVQVAKSYLTKEYSYEAVTIIKYCIRHEYDNDDDYDRVFWKYYEKLHDAEIIAWYLRKKPLKLFENIDEVLKHTSSHILCYQLHPIFKLFSTRSSPSVTEKIINFAKTSLKADSVNTVNFAIIALLHLTDPQIYFQSTSFLQPPEDGKIDYEKADKQQLEMQESLAKSMIGIQSPSVCLPSLLLFCKGDYLKYAYRPLYYITTRTPELYLDQFLGTLFNSAVSVRKHAVHIVTVVCPKEKIHSFLKQAGESDTHATLQKVVFKNTLRYFLGEQSEAFWDLLQRNIKIIDKDDTEAYDHLLSLEKIPSDYLPRYIQLVYEILTNHESQQIQIKKWNLLQRIPDDAFKDLSKEFLEKVMAETLFTQNCRDFWLNCVFHKTGQSREEILIFAFERFKDYYDRNLPDSNSDPPREVLRNIYMFVYDFSMRAMAGDAKTVEKFIELWSATVTKKGFYEEVLQLQLAQSYLTCHSEDKLLEFADKVNVLLVNWVKEHDDASVVHLFTENLGMLLDTLDEGKLLLFLEKFCSASDLPNNCNYIVAMKLLSKRVNSRDFTTHFAGIIAKLRDCNVPSLRIRFGGFLKTLVA